MINRFRNVKSLKYNLLNTSFPINNNYNFWNYIETRYLNNSNDNNSYQIIKDFNRTEDLNKHRSIYINYLETLAVKKGYIFNIVGNKATASSGKITIENIINAEDIDNNTYQSLKELVEKGEENTDHKYQIEKYNYKNLLCCDELTEDTLEPFYNRKYLIDNFAGLIDEDNIDCNILKYKVSFINKVIYNLGFKHILDKIQIEPDIFKERFNRFFNKNLLNNPVEVLKIKAEFKFDKNYKINNKMTTKNILGFFNHCLKDFSIVLKTN